MPIPNGIVHEECSIVTMVINNENNDIILQQTNSQEPIETLRSAMRNNNSDDSFQMENGQNEGNDPSGSI